MAEVEQKIVLQAYHAGQNSNHELQINGALQAAIAAGFKIVHTSQSVIPDVYDEGYVGSRNGTIHVVYVLEKEVQPLKLTKPRIKKFAQ
ncbi:hypothetical protein [Hymenobacter fodinae]|uniref:Uncharacterized protein n=1 Tax=Hymenobacter fodinae TaxID=2510796 RepID=A0A4Z0P5B0_9BACT|nr:hypothetical protein [Hymenobacter fodinae]TGE05566.1 hypothetical protein EU556_19900 [Hymenobacter fodinae]